MTITTADIITALQQCEDESREAGRPRAAALELARRHFEWVLASENRERRIDAVEAEIDVLWRGFAL